MWGRLREEQSATVLAEGRPVIAIMGEYDALPGISQTAWAVKGHFATEPSAA